MIGPLDGNLRTSIALDPAPGCNCGQDTSSILTQQPVADLQLRHGRRPPDHPDDLPDRPNGPLPTQIQVTLTWNGTAQPPVIFQTTGHSPGDTYLAQRPGCHPGRRRPGPIPGRSISRRPCPAATSSTRTTSGMAFVVVNGSADPIGRGWSLGGSAQLFPDGSGGYFWVDGNGGVRDFQAGNGIDLRQPAQRLRHAGQERQRDIHLHRPAEVPVELQQPGLSDQHRPARRADRDLHRQLRPAPRLR